MFLKVYLVSHQLHLNSLFNSPMSLWQLMRLSNDLTTSIGLSVRETFLKSVDSIHFELFHVHFLK